MIEPTYYVRLLDLTSRIDEAEEAWPDPELGYMPENLRALRDELEELRSQAFPLRSPVFSLDRGIKLY